MEIPAGTRVHITTIQKGKPVLQEGEVLAHMNGVVHVDVAGQAVSVDPSQVTIHDPNAPAPAAPAENGNEKVTATLIAELTGRVAALEGAVGSIESRVTAIETRLPAQGGVVNPPAPAPEPAPEPAPAPAPEVPATPDAPAEETHSTTNSTAATDAGGSAAGSQ